MPRDADQMTEEALRAAIHAAEGRFADGDPSGALADLEEVRRHAPLRSRVWAEAMADIAVVLHAAGELYDAYAHARRALDAEPGLEEARGPRRSAPRRSGSGRSPRRAARGS